MNNLVDIENKVILVTGASGGIGKAVSLILSQCNAIPVLHYNKNIDEVSELNKQITDNGGQCFIVQADVRNEEEVKIMVKQIVEKYGRIDGLVNNAGILLRSFIALQTVDKFRNIIDINLIGNFIVLKHVCSQMIRQKYGAIVNMSSAAGMGGLKGQAAYSSTKGGLNALNIVSAKELADFNIRVNAVSPGFIATGMLDNTTEMDEKYKEVIPMKRFGKAQEVATVVAFLLSDAASYITGQNILIDGGLLIS